MTICDEWVPWCKGGWRSWVGMDCGFESSDWGGMTFRFWKDHSHWSLQCCLLVASESSWYLQEWSIVLLSLQSTEQLFSLVLVWVLWYSVNQSWNHWKEVEPMDELTLWMVVSTAVLWLLSWLWLLLFRLRLISSSLFWKYSLNSQHSQWFPLKPY